VARPKMNNEGKIILASLLERKIPPYGSENGIQVGPPKEVRQEKDVRGSKGITGGGEHPEKNGKEYDRRTLRSF